MMTQRPSKFYVFPWHLLTSVNGGGVDQNQNGLNDQIATDQCSSGEDGGSLHEALLSRACSHSEDPVSEEKIYYKRN